MSFPNKYLFIFAAAILPVVCTSRLPADDLPGYDDANRLSQKVKQAAGDFFNKTFEIRMRYEYAGRLTDPNDKIKLLELAAKASADLEQIADDQNNLKKQIEDYQGDDWETRFGQTGLWRRLTADLQKTKSETLEIGSISAIADGTKSDCPPCAVRSNCAAIKTALEQIKCLGRCEPNELEKIAGTLAKSECSDNPELLLSLAILQNKYAPDKLKNTLSRSSQTGQLLGKIILADLSSDPNLDSLNPVTAELAAFSAWQTNPSAYKELLLAIANTDKLKTPGTLGIAGAAVAESEPQTAVKLLMESSLLQFQQKETLLDLDARATAEHAARLACDNFARQNIDCNLAVAAFGNYANIASNKMTEEMRYLYGEILLDCGKTQNALETFTKLADTSQSVWRDKATFQLLKIQISAGREESLPQLQKLILNCTGQDEQKLRLRLEAMDLYCRTALGRDNNDSAAQVLDLLDSAEPTPDFHYDLYRAQATFRLGRLEDSARCMTKAADANDNSIAPQAVLLLSEILDKIELWQQNARDFNEMLQNCDNLAQYAHKSLNDRRTLLVLEEFSIVQKKDCPEPFSSLDDNDVTSLRPIARLLMTQGNFKQGAPLWAKIANMRRNESAGQNQKSYGWWQAKFYELDCLTKLPSANLKDIHHTIEVLQSTYTEIPVPFAEKLDSLKRHCTIN